MKLFILLSSLLIGGVLQATALASFPIPLPFDKLVDESTTIVICKVIRMTPLVSEDDEQVQEESLGQYLGPNCFSLVKVIEVWKQHPFENEQDAPAAAVYDSQGSLTIAHGSGSRGIGGLSNDLTEGRIYVLFLTMIQPGMYRFTDGNSVYPIYQGRVPEMGINMNIEDIATSNPSPVDQFKVRVLKEIGNPMEDARQQDPSSEQGSAK